MGRVARMGDRKCWCCVFVGKQEGKKLLIGNGKITLKWISKKKDGWVWAGRKMNLCGSG
jgi:hypothetical protein